jgi:hypothetical protein
LARAMFWSGWLGMLRRICLRLVMRAAAVAPRGSEAFARGARVRRRLGDWSMFVVSAAADYAVQQQRAGGHQANRALN